MPTIAPPPAPRPRRQLAVVRSIPSLLLALTLAACGVAFVLVFIGRDDAFVAAWKKKSRATHSAFR